MEMGCISSMNEKDFPIMTANCVPNKSVGDKKAVEDFLLWQMEGTFEIMRRIGGKTFIIGAGTKTKDIPDEKQYENVVANMRFCAEHCLKNGFTMEIEPLNEKMHRGVYVTHAALGAKICKDVNMPSCRLLYDVYHEHMQTGSNAALDDAEIFKHILSFHLADAPQRKEPGTGEIDFETILKKIWQKGFRGIIGLEHGQTDNSKEGDKKLWEIYRKLDACAS
jgi:Hydroxypyruvate isomerase